MATVFFFGDEGKGAILFGILPALNKDHKAVPDTEIIKMSRGFAICMILALCFAVVRSFRDLTFGEDQQILRKVPSWTVIIGKLSAILALIVGVLIQLPEGIQHSLLSGSF